MLLRIVSSYFCAGIILEDKTVVKTAPILHYMLGWNETKVQSYCRKKGWFCCAA